MSSITERGRVPVARRQLLAEPAKLAVSVVAIAAAVALVLLLTGLRRGIGEQVTLYLDRQPGLLVGQAGARNFIGQASVQLHGGIGVTDEYVGSHYFKKLTQLELTFGDTLHHLGEVSQRMQDTAGVFA